MLANEKVVKKFLKEWENDCKKDEGGRFFNEDKIARNYQWLEEDISKVLNNSKRASFGLMYFERLSDFYLDQNHYHIIHTKDLESAKEEFLKSTCYGYLYLSRESQGFECLGKQRLCLMDQALLYFSQAVLCGWEEKYLELLDIFIDSIDFDVQIKEDKYKIYKIIGVGDVYTPAHWFIFELYAKAYNKKLDHSQANYPENMKPYDEVLEKWDTKDLTEVQRLLYILCDVHLEQTKERKSDDEYFEFDNSQRWLFPYEILVWLKLREKHGLENPTEFLHPLMTNPVAEFFLQFMSEVQDNPKELPYARELLVKLKKYCPQIELDACDRSSLEKKKSLQQDSIQLKPAPKTGNYQATLPKDHPQYETLKADPNAYRTYKEGEAFDNRGLEIYDLKNIEWICIE